MLLVVASISTSQFVPVSKEEREDKNERGVSPPSLVHRPSMIPPGLVPPPAHLANMLSQLAAASQGVGGSGGGGGPRGRCWWSAQGRVDEDEDCVQLQAGPGTREGVPLLSLPNRCQKDGVGSHPGADWAADKDLVSKPKDEVKEGAKGGEDRGKSGYVPLLPVPQLNAGDVHAVAQWWGKQHPVISKFLQSMMLSLYNTNNPS